MTGLSREVIVEVVGLGAGTGGQGYAVNTVGDGRSFHTSGVAYDAFIGRYARPLAELFADAADVQPGQTALDVGCGPGALTSVLADLLGPTSVLACDPSPPFVDECSKRCPGVQVRSGSAEALPYPNGSFDRVLSQLVLHFVSDPAQAAREFHRVVRPGGVVAACVWDYEQEMEMLRHFWDAASVVDPAMPDQARALRLGKPGEITQLLRTAGVEECAEATLRVSSTYTDFEELWVGFTLGIGPAGTYCTGLTDDRRRALRDAMFERVGSPPGAFTLSAVARSVAGRKVR